MIKAIIFLSILISGWNAKGAIPIKISKIISTKEELVIFGTQLENTEAVSIRDLDNKILKEYLVDNATSEKIVAKPLDDTPRPLEKNLKLVITNSEGDFDYPITQSSFKGTKTIYKISKKKNIQTQKKLVVDEKSEINFSPSEDSEGYDYNYSIYANPVGVFAIKNEEKDLFKLDNAGNLEISGTLKVKGKEISFNNPNIQMSDPLGPIYPQNSINGNYRIADVVIGTDNNISGVVNFTSSGNMDVATATFHVDSATSRVGVGTSTPTYKLDVKGSANSGIRLRQASVSTNTSGGFFNGMVFEDPGLVKSFGIGYGQGDLFSINSFDGTFYRNIFSLNNVGNGAILGSLKIGAYTLPATDGANGTALRTNGAGVVSWGTSGTGDVSSSGTFRANVPALFSNTTGKIIIDGNASLMDFDSTGSAPAYKEARIFYDSATKSLAYYSNTTGLPIEIGQQIVFYARNNTGGTIPAGSAVYVTGAFGGGPNARPTIALAIANSVTTSRIIGITAQAIGAGVDGYVTNFGLVRGVDTSGFPEGQILYLSDTVAGTFTITPPQLPVPAGRVIYSNTANGIIGVAPVVGAGNVFGPGTSLDGRPAIYSGTTGKQLTNTVPYTIPIVNGTNGQVLTTNGAGSTSWTSVAGTGNVVGPASATDGNFAVFDGVTGKLIKDGGFPVNLLNGVPIMLNASTGADNLIVSQSGGPRLVRDSGINSGNLTQMTLNATALNQMILSGGVSKQLVATPYTVPGINGSIGQVLTVTGLDTTAWSDPVGTGDVIGPASATVDTPALFANGTGKVIYGGSAAYMDLQTSILPPTWKEGRIFYNNSEKTISYHSNVNGLTINLGQELTREVTNNSGVDINIGQPVYQTGSSGLNLTVALAQADNDDRANVFGVALQNIPNGTKGFITAFGIVRNLNTNSFSDGEDLYLSSTVAGGYTSTPPSIVTKIGVVIKSDPTAGIIGVTPRLKGRTVSGPLISATNRPALYADDTGKDLKEAAYTLPLTSGSVGTVLGITGAGTAGWVTAGAGNVIGPATNASSTLAQWSGVNSKTLTQTPYTFPTIAGTIGQVLGSDGTNVTWQSAGDVIGPILPTVANRAAVFADATGKLLAEAPYTLPMDQGTIGQVLTVNGIGTTIWGNSGMGDVSGPATSTNFNLAAFNGTNGKTITDSGINGGNVNTMASLPTLANQMVITKPFSKELITTSYSMPPGIGSSNYVLKSDGTNVIWGPDAGSTSVILTKWTPQTLYVTDQIQFAGVDGNWLLRTATDTVSSDIWWQDVNNGTSVPVAPPLVTTGIVRGGAATLAGNTVTIQPGDGFIADYENSLSPYPQIKVVYWPTLTLDITGNGVYSVFIGSNGLPFSIPGLADELTLTQNISVAIVDKDFGKIYNRKTYPTNPLGQLISLSNFLEGMVKDLSYSGAGASTINRSAYSEFLFGIDTDTDHYSPNTKGIAAQSPMQFNIFTKTGPVGGVTTNFITTQFDNNGTLTNLNPNQWGFARFYVSIGGDDAVMYAQKAYGTQSEAEKGIFQDPFATPPQINQLYRWVGYVVFVRGDANLADNTFYTCQPFGCGKNAGGGSGGGGAGDVFGPPTSVPNRLAIYADSSGNVLDQAAFAPPSSTGTVGQVLASNGDGTTKWSTLTGGIVPTRASLPSDRKLKKEIKDLTESYIDKILDLRPVSFVWKDTSQADIGFIAQEVKKVFPGLVEEDAGYIGVNYQKMVVPLVKAFQEQQKEIKKYQDIISRLEERIQKLEEKNL